MFCEEVENYPGEVDRGGVEGHRDPERVEIP